MPDSKHRQVPPTAGSSRSDANPKGGRAGVAALVLMLAGAGLAHLGILPPLGGFVILALSIPFALFAVVSGLVGLARSFGSEAGSAGAFSTQRGVGLVCALVVVACLGMGARSGAGLPRINDITTDLDDPPSFVHAGTLGPNLGRDMGYPGESFARQQLEGYPDLGNLVLKEAPPQAFAKVRSVLASMGDVEITFEDAASGHLEATATSFAFRFVDDVVVRVRDSPGGATVDIRSKSRDGKGDMGANAARIRQIYAALR